MKIKRITQILVLVSLMTLIGAIAIAQASTVEPVFYPDNPTCSDLGLYGIKIDPPIPGTYPIDGGFVTFTTEDGIHFDWESTIGIDAVISKGGNGANIYFYDESMGDTDLYSPENASGGAAAISHIDFCFDYELEIDKTAVPYFTREYDWTIAKSVDPAKWELFVGDQATSTYTVSVVKEYTDYGWKIEGVISIYNPAPDPVDFTIEDYLTGFVDPLDLTCPATTIAAGGTWECEYSVNLDSGAPVTNTVYVTSLTSGVTGGEASASASFTTPANEILPEINVDDTNGASWTFDKTGSVTYDRTFECGESYTYDNTATIRETGQHDDASVDVICNALQVSKTADTSFTRTWEWTIEKSVSPEAWELFKGDDATSTWTVSVDKTGFVDSDWAVSGSIYVYNPANIAAEITDVTDLVSDIGPAVVDCGVSFPHILAAGQTLVCSYSLDLPNDQERTNQATAVLQNYAYAPDGQGTKLGKTSFYSPQVKVSFENADITVLNDTIHVTDTNGMSWEFSDDASEPYNETFYCDADNGNHKNTATITETGQYADADLDVACFDLTVTKTADTFFNRYWTWDIEKSADQTEMLLSAGQLQYVNYDVTVRASFEDADFMVSGEIKITNPAPTKMASLTDVIDELEGYTNVAVSCPTYIIPAGGTITCTYEQAVTDKTSLDNIATAFLQNYSYSPTGAMTMLGSTAFASPKVTAIFSEASLDDEIDECVEVTDTLAGYLGTVCQGDAPKTFSYALSFGLHPDADVLLECGYNETPNMAKLVTNDTATEDYAEWIVYTDVACDFGCTLTPGYWKTHSQFGPAPYDDTWELLGPAAEYTIFFSSNQTYYEVLWTNPKGGNAYYILAHAYIAAKLNVLNGASMPDNVLEAFNAATGLFEKYTPAQVADMKGQTGKTIRALFIELATILDDYNNGYYGPGHCTE